ncbi:hypothetical protein LOTGIDRAFT_236889 [Lottia gigantea]|uniref:Uncharacterized protein n=1 Tax=Lottia gigantea TaxID=225164 RepID=V3YXY4_LOTGI|nr:hypothetical protein LOTGIDRAFT_236889 [Lottia gigantea]ESO82953.1 hypothetical protein LOTGIDRAFT_236889 [Lottia gigantea]
MSTQLLKDGSQQTACQCEIGGSDVCEDALDKLVHRILLSASMNEKDGDKFGIADVDDGNLAPVDYRKIPKINGVRLQERYDKARKNKNQKKESRKSKWEKNKVDDMPRGTVQKVDGNSYVNVPLEVYRRMVQAEIDAKMKQVQEYQDYFLKKQEDTRLEALREVFYWKEYSKSLEANLSVTLGDLQTSEEAFEYASKRLQLYESYVPSDAEKLFEPWKLKTAIDEVREFAQTRRNQKRYRKGSKRQQIVQPVVEELSESAQPPAVHLPEPNSKSDPNNTSNVRPSSSASELGTGSKTSKQRRNKILRGLAKDTVDLPQTT